MHYRKKIDEKTDAVGREERSDNKNRKTETNDKRTEQSASIMFIPRTSGGELAGKMKK